MSSDSKTYWLRCANRIHGYMLFSDKPIKISRHRDPNRDNKPRRHRSKFTVFSTTKIDKGKEKVLPVSKVLSISGLLVSKTTNSEASSIFYGFNTFIFNNVLAIGAFMNMTRDNFDLMTNIEIGNITHWDWSGLFGRLRSITSPARIVFPVNVVAVPADRSELVLKLVVRAIGPFLTQKPCTYRKEDGTYEHTISKLDVDQQMKRFHAIFFKTDAELPLKDADGSMVDSKDPERYHKFKNAVLDLWRKGFVSVEAKGEDGSESSSSDDDHAEMEW